MEQASAEARDVSGALPESLSEYLRAFRIDVRQDAGRYELLIPSFSPIEWQAPPVRRLSRYGNLYEAAATAAISYFLEAKAARAFMDIGAAVGYFTRLVSHYEERVVDVRAFEMMPGLHAALLESERLRPVNVKAHLAGMSDRHRGPQRIWYSRTKMFESEPDPRLFRDNMWVRLWSALRGKKKDALREAEVMVTSIDHYCAETGFRPDIVKIDVDGYEAKVVPGGMATFARDRPVVLLELHRQKFLERFDVTREQIVGPLFDLGYRALLLDDRMDRVSGVTPVEAGSPIIRRDATDMLIFY